MTIEKNLEEQYSSILQTIGFSSSEVINIVRNMLSEAKRESQHENMTELPQNFGDFLLENESKTEKIKIMLAKRRKEGVKDDDIRWWWNMHDLERRMMLKFDDLTRLSMYKTLREEDGLNEQESAKEVRQYHPIYGNPDDTNHSAGEDRPLPEELKDRINIYIEKMSTIAPEKHKQQIIKDTSFNALIRNLIKKGKL